MNILKLSKHALRFVVSIVVVTIVASSLSGCVIRQNRYGERSMSKANTGLVGGAIVGGALGVALGNGSVGGALLGTILGGAAGAIIGNQMDEHDIEAQEETAQAALRYNRPGVPMRWANSNSGNYGTITPTTRINRYGDYQYCREYTADIVIGGKKKSGYGVACMEQDGTWRVVSTH